jgi:hypothetical protein
MRRLSVLIAMATVASAARAQQPARTRDTIPISVRRAPDGCPIIVVDGQTVAPARSDCAPEPGSHVTPPSPADPLARLLYPPELVMAHQEAIGLTEKQRSAIQAAVKDAQAKVVDVQFKMSAEVEKLQHLLQIFTPDEPTILDEVGRVLTLERDMKLAQMTLMIRIKSQLTERQQGLLDQMRNSGPGYYLNGTPTPRPPEL